MAKGNPYSLPPGPPSGALPQEQGDAVYWFNRNAEKAMDQYGITRKRLLGRLNEKLPSAARCSANHLTKVLRGPSETQGAPVNKKFAEALQQALSELFSEVGATDKTPDAVLPARYFIGADVIQMASEKADVSALLHKRIHNMNAVKSRIMVGNGFLIYDHAERLAAMLFFEIARAGHAAAGGIHHSRDLIRSQDSDDKRCYKQSYRAVKYRDER